MASASSSYGRRCTTCFTEEGAEILKSKRSSVIIDCSDGSKMIFVRGPHPRSGSSWVSPSESSSPSPPSAPPAQGLGSAPGPNTQPSGTPRPRHKDSNQPASSSTSRTCGARGTPRSGYGSTEASSHDYSHRTSPTRLSRRHGTTGASLRRNSTRKPTGNGRSNPSFDGNSELDRMARVSMEAVVGVTPLSEALGYRQGRGQDKSEQMGYNPGYAGVGPNPTAFLHVDANIRGGSGGPRRRSDSKSNKSKSGGILQCLRRYFSFSYPLLRDRRGDYVHDRSRPRSRSRRTGGH